jgi:type IX secretion system PorP/SprF family membrane protein
MVFMHYIRNIFSAIVLCFISGVGFAQQVPLYSQYIMNGFLVNPSIAGRDGYTTINLTVREQWVGLQDAPSTYAASFQTRLLRNSYISKSTAVKKKLVKPTKGSRVGLGGYIFSDYNGIMRRTGGEFVYAYHIPLGVTNGLPNSLSFGLAFTAYQYAVNLNGAIYNHDDPLLNSFDRSVFIPDFNFGASFTTVKYYIGFSMTNLLRGALMFADTSSVNRKELGHYFLTGGIKIPLADNWKLEPSAFIKSSDMFFTAIQADITTRVYYREDYWAGVSYRTSNAIVAMFGLRYDRFYIGYAFDFTMTAIRSQTLGSHELSLAVKFGESARRYRWLNGL